VLAVVAAFGYVRSPAALAALPVIVLLGLAFAALGLAINALATGYDFFSYYMTVVLTPMLMLSGVFFPVEHLPSGVQVAANLLPLYHGVSIMRPLLAGEIAPGWFGHLAVIVAYAMVALYIAVVLTRRRLLR
jgi:lipooligosaccharide transport system permease protein